MNDIKTYEDLDELKGARIDYERFTGPSDQKITITIDTHQLENFRRRIENIWELRNKKDEYLFQAVRNLLIKNNFLELTLKLSDEQISEDEFNTEMDTKPERYIINVDYLKDPNDIFIIIDIVKRIGQELSVDEVADIFSLDPHDIEEKAHQLK